MEKTAFRITFFIGTDAVKSDPQAGADYYEYRLRHLKETVATIYRGYSIREVQGGWFDDQHNLIEETSLEVSAMVWTDDFDNLKAMADYMAGAMASDWQQDCVLVTIQALEHMAFITE